MQNNFLYLIPCHILKTKVLLESKFVAEEMGEGQLILLKLPSKVLSTQDTLSYTFLSFMAEFGSWLGLFTGLAVVQVNISYLNSIYIILLLGAAIRSSNLVMDYFSHLMLT